MTNTINPVDVVSIQMMSEGEGRPVVRISEEVNGAIRNHLFPIYTAHGIFVLNQVLESFDLPLDIKFRSYKQYSVLLDEVMQHLNILKLIEHMGDSKQVTVNDVTGVLLDELSFKYEKDGFDAFMDDLEEYVKEAIDIVKGIQNKKATV